MLEVFNPYFPTIVSKTFFVLILSFISTCLGMISVYLIAKIASSNAAPSKKLSQTSFRNPINGSIVTQLFWVVLGTNVLSVIALYIVPGSNLKLILLFLFTFTEGLMLGVIVLPLAFLAIIALLITIVVAIVAGGFGYLTNVDFEFLGVFLFIGLIGLLIAGVYRIFNHVKERKARITAIFGILIFAGYLIFDFNNLRKLQNIDKFNNWETAIETSTNIYLDLINLFLYILDLLLDN